MILQMSMKESSSSRTLNSLFLILSLNDFFGSSLRELGISFHNLAPNCDWERVERTRGKIALQSNYIFLLRICGSNHLKLFLKTYQNGRECKIIEKGER